MPTYEKLTPEIENKIVVEKAKNTFASLAFREYNVIRRNPDKDKADIIRTAFVRDCDKIIHCPFYNRYADKTRVFSFYKNDDISRRSLHVQLVSRIARTIGKALNLNLDLIEAIALGHDIGHTPFGHAGEAILDELYFAHAGRHFSHNIHSVRVLDGEEIRDVPAADMAFSYRHSRAMEEGWVILGALFRLEAGDGAAIDAAMRDYAARRKEKQPLEFPSAGSFFKRPAGHFAGQLIEEAGLKGKAVGGAQVSEKHAGFLINRGGATAADFLALKELVQEEVYRRFGVRLEPEVRIVGEKA